MTTNPEKPETADFSTGKTVKNERKGPITTDVNFTEGLNDFIQRNRRSLAFVLCTILILVGALIAGLSIRDGLRGQAIKAVEILNQRYETLRPDLASPALETDVNALLDELVSFAEKNSGYAGAKAYSLAAAVCAGKTDWAAAEEHWKNAARKSAGTYLEPVSFFNAATAAEEQGKTLGAIELYAECVSRRDTFPAAPRAQFSIGRLWETEGNTAAALAAYNEILNIWSDDSVWTSLAQNRIIALNISSR